ncbi:MAG: DUF5606 domain-containing protein [Bacteroidales bacterium]|nr:DUF5606 domain-containing protein [Bacteroidales bacterium]
MDLKKIVAIAGKSGLFRVVNQAKSGVIVESLTDGKRFPAFLHDRISSLEEISVYTTEEDRPLKDIFKGIYDFTGGKEAIDNKSDNKELKKFFAQAIPDFDEERVYVSDIKKIIGWYNQLQKNNELDFSETEAETDSGTPEESAS